MVLGPVLSLEEPTEAPLQARVRAALLSSVGVARRIRLLDATVLSSLLRGMESLDLTSKQRRSLYAVLRAMVLYMMRPPKRSCEKEQSFYERRERLVTHAIRTNARRNWGDLQRYPYNFFIGHVARLPSSTLVCSRQHVEVLELVAGTRAGVGYNTWRTSWE